MAPSSNLISLLFLTTLLFSLQTDARESQFFSKVPHFNNNVKDTQVVPNNEGPTEQKQAVFIPETDNSYGLYGHESGLNPPSSSSSTSTTTTYQPYKTESEETTKFTNNNNNFYSFNKDSFSTNQNELSDARLAGNSYSSSSNNNNNNNYFFDNTKDNGFSGTKYTEGGYNSPMENQNSNQKYYYNNNNDRYSFNNNNGANNRYFYNNGERQGLSDTRFMEGGKYFYDVNSEKYNPTAREGVSSENWYNNRGYFGNNNYHNKKSMEGYQNQEVFEDEQEVFEP
ncbi:protein E6-like [Arachis stenosperma]|uniref:protein E6-like n=1 Tax=Arachis stenosperma TaxID=217475 RepID=UPI0025AD1C6F|nr:protein E6-like [Arachis stenosperma]